MKKSFRLGFYLVFGIVNIGIFIFGIHNINNVIKIYQYSESVNLLFYHTSNINNAVQRYYMDDIHDADYYKTCHSKNLHEYKTYFQQLKLEADKIIHAEFSKNFSVNTEINILINDYNAFNSNLNILVEESKYKGYIDYGKEGDMRKNAHYLEAMHGVIPLQNILKLRRHEKDYLLRGDESYITKLHIEIEDLKKTIQKRTLDHETSKHLTNKLTAYESCFLDLVRATKEIEKRKSRNLDLMSSHIQPKLGTIILSIKEKKEKLINNCIRDFMILSFIFLISTCIIGYKLNHYQNQHIEDIEVYLRNILRCNYENQPLIHKLNQTPAIRRISIHLQRLESTLKKGRHCIPSKYNPEISPSESTFATVITKNFSKLI